MVEDQRPERDDLHARRAPPTADRWAAAGCAGCGAGKRYRRSSSGPRNLRLARFAPCTASEGELVVSDDGRARRRGGAPGCRCPQAAGLAGERRFNGPRQEGVGLFQATVAMALRHRQVLLAGARRVPTCPCTPADAPAPDLRRYAGDRRGVSPQRDSRTRTASSEVVFRCRRWASPHLLLNRDIGAADELHVGIRPLIDRPASAEPAGTTSTLPLPCATHERFGILHRLRKRRKAALPLSRARSQRTARPRTGLHAGATRVGPGTGDPDLQLYCIPSANRRPQPPSLGRPGHHAFLGPAATAEPRRAAPAFRRSARGAGHRPSVLQRRAG